MIIGVVSHELAESITDPEGSAWFDAKHNEIGDDCVFIYGGGFGGVPGSYYNQTINGAHYFTQEEFSNEDFKYNRATSCAQRVDLPTAAFKITPSSPKAGKTVLFSGKTTKGNITTYSWDFGDHSPLGSGVTVTHVYATPGVFSVKLTVTDRDGLTGTTSSTLNVAS